MERQIKSFGVGWLHVCVGAWLIKEAKIETARLPEANNQNAEGETASRKTAYKEAWRKNTRI